MKVMGGGLVNSVKLPSRSAETVLVGDLLGQIDVAQLDPEGLVRSSSVEPDFKLGRLVQFVALEVSLAR